MPAKAGIQAILAVQRALQTDALPLLASPVRSHLTEVKSTSTRNGYFYFGKEGEISCIRSAPHRLYKPDGNRYPLPDLVQVSLLYLPDSRQQR